MEWAFVVVEAVFSYSRHGSAMPTYGADHNPKLAGSISLTLFVEVASHMVEGLHMHIFSYNEIKGIQSVGAKMPCRIVLIRHGLTYWNAKKKMQGQVNIPLNETGVRQAHALADQLADYHFDACFSSPLDRAIKTARIVLANRDVPIVKDERLLEHGYGIREGTHYRHTPWFVLFNGMHDYEAHPERYQAPMGGESFDAVYARAQAFVDEVLLPESSCHECILVAAHSGINCAIMGRMFNIPLDRFWSVRQTNCGYTVVDVVEGHFVEVYHTPIEDI